MNRAHWERPAYAWGLGAAAGLLSGLLGIGGGLVIGPALAVAGLPLPTAVGTALLVVAPVAAVGVVAELFTAPEHLAWATALAIAIGGQVGAQLGGGLMRRLSETMLRWLFLLLLAYAAMRNLGVIGELPEEGVTTGFAAASPALGFALAALVGVLAGATSSLFGIGGGVVVVPALVFLVGGFGFHAAAGTSLLAMVPTALRAGWIAHKQGRIDLRIGRRLAPTGLLGAAAGVLLRNAWLEPAVLAALFGGFLLYAIHRLGAPAGPDRAGDAGNR